MARTAQGQALGARQTKGFAVDAEPGSRFAADRRGPTSCMLAAERTPNMGDVMQKSCRKEMLHRTSRL